mgnify:CR=1 FL=1
MLDIKLFKLYFHLLYASLYFFRSLSGFTESTKSWDVILFDKSEMLLFTTLLALAAPTAPVVLYRSIGALISEAIVLMKTTERNK